MMMINRIVSDISTCELLKSMSETTARTTAGLLKNLRKQVMPVNNLLCVKVQRTPLCKVLTPPDIITINRA